MILKAFDNYVTGLMYADIFFPSGRGSTACVFNTFRSRKQYIGAWLQLSRLMAVELGKISLGAQERQSVFFRLQQVGKLFICEGQEVVSHSHLLVHRGGMPVHVATLDVHEQMLLRSFLRIQYTAWLELCELCNSVLSFYQGNYVWQGNVLELLELGDALWVTGRVSPQDGEKSKRQYLRRLLALFRFPVPDQPCRRLGELTGRVRPEHLCDLAAPKIPGLLAQTRTLKLSGFAFFPLFLSFVMLTSCRMWMCIRLWTSVL